MAKACGDFQIGIAAPINSLQIGIDIDKGAAEQLYLPAMRMTSHGQLRAVRGCERKKRRVMR